MRYNQLVMLVSIGRIQLTVAEVEEEKNAVLSIKRQRYEIPSMLAGIRN